MFSNHFEKYFFKHFSFRTMNSKRFPVSNNNRIEFGANFNHENIVNICFGSKDCNYLLNSI